LLTDNNRISHNLRIKALSTKKM